MICLLIFGIVVGASAAPHFDHGRHQHHHGPGYLSQYHHHSSFDSDNYFDTNKFWSEFNRDMQNLNNVLSEFTHQFPTSFSQEGVEGNNYKITIPLRGFNENEIIVKAREGWLMIQAQSKRNPGINNYLNIRSLPNTINVNGSWTYSNGVLTLLFPLKEGTEVHSVEAASVAPTESSTNTPTFDREDLDSDHAQGPVTQDADVPRGDVDLEVKTNEVDNANHVEATTYAVDLKNEVEFVPVRY